VRRLDNGLAESAPPRSADCSSAAIAARANKRRFVNLLQQLARSARARQHCSDELFCLFEAEVDERHRDCTNVLV